MAPDNSYRPNVYREQGGDALVVRSGGTLELATGSKWTQSIRTATQSLTLDGSESGQTVITTVANLTHTVPLASTNQGASYTFVLGTTALAGAGATGLHLRHQGSNRFIGGGLTAATNQSVVLLGATDVSGDSISMTSDGNSTWWITNAVGGWSVISAT